MVPPHEHSPSTDDATHLTLEREFAAPREALYRAIVEPDLLAQWFGPEGTRVPRESVEVVPEVGGPFRLTMLVDAMPGFESPVDATIVDIEPGRLLVGEEVVPGDPHAYEHGEEPEDLTLRLRLECEDVLAVAGRSRSRLRLTQGPFPAMVAEQGRLGWESSFAKLDRVLASL